MLRKVLFGLMSLFSLGIATYAVIGYSALPLGDLVHPDMKVSFNNHRLWLYLHVFGASVALFLGPWQFMPHWRASHPFWHRLSGRLYLGVGVLIGGVAGLMLAPHAFGGAISQSGFAVLALLWLLSGWQAFRAIREKNIALHQRWMRRNFALTLAAVTLRIQLPISIASGISFDEAYPIIAWSCWLPNLVLVEMYWRYAAREKTLTPLNASTH